MASLGGRTYMQEAPAWKIAAPRFVIALLLTVNAACSGSGSSGDGFPNTSGSATGSASSAPTSPSTTILFAQPQNAAGIAGQLVVPPANNTPPPTDSFVLVLWQANRYQQNGELIPTAWDAGSQTGFTPVTAMTAQLGFEDTANTSTAQMEGDTVGAYINSQDLPQSSADQKMMITPEFIFAAGSQPMPFVSAQSSLSGSMDLQIPTAVGSDAYVVLDLLFKSVNGVRISYGVKVFHNGGDDATAAGYDQPSNSYMLNSALGFDDQYVTRASDSASATGTPWLGWTHFDWTISEAQFVSGLQYLATQFPAAVTSTDPAQYVLAEVHLNAEFHTLGQPAALGWSMRRLQISSTP